MSFQLKLCLHSPECPTASTSIGNDPLRRESKASLSVARRTDPSRRSRNQDNECFIFVFGAPTSSCSSSFCCCCCSWLVHALNADSSVSTGLKISAPPEERRRSIFFRFLAVLFTPDPPPTPRLTINKLSVGMELLRFTESGTVNVFSGAPPILEEDAACCAVITCADRDSPFSSGSIESAMDDHIKLD